MTATIASIGERRALHSADRLAHALLVDDAGAVEAVVEPAEEAVRRAIAFMLERVAGLAGLGARSRGMTAAGGHVYYVRDGSLYAMDFAGAPVPGTETAVSGAAVGDGQVWTGRGLFVASP